MPDYAAHNQNASLLFWSQVGATDFAAFSVPSYLGDDTPPTTTLISPIAPNPLGRTTPVVVDVFDARLRRTYVWIAYPSGEWEVAYAYVKEGDEWLGQFSRRFRRSTVTGDTTKRFTLVREGGWPYGSLDVNVDPIDAGGNTSP